MGAKFSAEGEQVAARAAREDGEVKCASAFAAVGEHGRLGDGEPIGQLLLLLLLLLVLLYGKA